MTTSSSEMQATRDSENSVEAEILSFMTRILGKNGNNRH